MMENAAARSTLDNDPLPEVKPITIRPLEEALLGAEDGPGRQPQEEEKR
jgi:hypothetical protein